MSFLLFDEIHMKLNFSETVYSTTHSSSTNHSVCLQEKLHVLYTSTTNKNKMVLARLQEWLIYLSHLSLGNHIIKAFSQGEAINDYTSVDVEKSSFEVWSAVLKGHFSNHCDDYVIGYLSVICHDFFHSK